MNKPVPEKIEPCPGCGKVHDMQDFDDMSYPMNRNGSAWKLTCNESIGGCGWTVYDTSEERCVEKWNVLSINMYGSDPIKDDSVVG